MERAARMGPFTNHQAKGLEIKKVELAPSGGRVGLLVTVQLPAPLYSGSRRAPRCRAYMHPTSGLSD